MIATPRRSREGQLSGPVNDDMTQSVLAAVFLANRAPLQRFLRARGAVAEAEDILQDMWIKLSQLDDVPVAEPLSYLYRMADNQMLDRHRASTRRTRRETVWGESAEPDGSDAERSLIAREGLDMVRAELGRLGDRTQSILYRYRVDGMSQKDIASELGVSLSLVEKHLQRAYRALLALKRAMRADDDGKTIRQDDADVG